MTDSAPQVTCLPEPGGEGSKREQAYLQLRRLLILQQIPGGERLREAEWTERLKVNRTALREAFARLHAEGLIEVGAKTGYFVPVLRRQDIRDVLGVRVTLEGGAIDMIVEAGFNTPKRLKPMKDACDQLDRLVTENYLLSVTEADFRFHESLIAASGNPRLVTAYRHAPLPIILPEVVSGPQWESAVRQTVAEHRAILAAILDGDAERAKKLLRSHVTERSLVVAASR